MASLITILWTEVSNYFCYDDTNISNMIFTVAHSRYREYIDAMILFIYRWQPNNDCVSSQKILHAPTSLPKGEYQNRNMKVRYNMYAKPRCKGIQIVICGKRLVKIRVSTPEIWVIKERLKKGKKTSCWRQVFAIRRSTENIREKINITRSTR